MNEGVLMVVKLEIEIDELKHIFAVLAKSDPLQVYGAKPLIEKMQKQVEAQQTKASDPVEIRN
jgi:hypothetical protein